MKLKESLQDVYVQAAKLSNFNSFAFYNFVASVITTFKRKTFSKVYAYFTEKRGHNISIFFIESKESYGVFGTIDGEKVLAYETKNLSDLEKAINDIRITGLGNTIEIITISFRGDHVNNEYTVNEEDMEKKYQSGKQLAMPEYAAERGGYI